jgi:microcystin degradation protein MlrC
VSPFNFAPSTVHSGMISFDKSLPNASSKPSGLRKLLKLKSKEHWFASFKQVAEHIFYITTS